MLAKYRHNSIVLVNLIFSLKSKPVMRVLPGEEGFMFASSNKLWCRLYKQIISFKSMTEKMITRIMPVSVKVFSWPLPFPGLPPAKKDLGNFNLSIVTW